MKLTKILSLFFISLFICQGIAFSQKDSLSYKGIRFQYSVDRLVLDQLAKGRADFEAMIDIGVKPDVFLVAEGGRTTLDRDALNYTYQLSGSYFRAGFDKNINKNSNDIISFGLRYGTSFFNHEVTSITLTDTIWNNGGEFTYFLPQEQLNYHWVEAVFQVKVEVFKNFYLGWGVRGKARLFGAKNNITEPYIVPGFGRGNRRAAGGFNYYVGYKIPF